MKKSLIALAIAATSVLSAQAQVTPVEATIAKPAASALPPGLLSNARVGLSYDFAEVNGKNPVRNQQEARLVIAKPTSVGTIDVGVVVRDTHGSGLSSSSNQGFEVGYANSVYLLGATVYGRVGYGQINGVTNARLGQYTGLTGNGSYASITTEVIKPITSNIAGFAGYRFTKGLEQTIPNQNRFYGGAELAVTSTLGLRGAYTHDRQHGQIANGFSVAAVYKF